MLTDRKAIEIISGAKQPNVRDPNRKREPFEYIMSDFFAGVDLAGKRWLDLGPGQHDFGVLARERGAHVVALDKDPAVVALGDYLGFDSVEGDIRDLANLFEPGSFDGVFCKYSVNALWFKTAPAVVQHVSDTVALMKPNGLAWIAPWNGVPKAMTDADAEPLLAAQHESFIAAGFEALELDKDQSRHYGVHGKTANRVVFWRGLTHVN